MADSTNRVFLVCILLVALATVGIFLQPNIEEKLAPEPEIAWVGIQCDPDGPAVVGPVQRRVGDVPCMLHAVLEARDRNDEPVYYTEAEGLRFGDVDVDPDRLRRWRRGRWIKARWFTLEGERPYIRLNNEDGIAGFRPKEFFRSDWPLAWSIPANVDASNDNHLADGSVLERQLFGTQRYHVRVEIYRFEDDLFPLQVVRSWGINDLKEHFDAFPTLEVTQPGPLEPVSRVFGLTQLEPPQEASPELLEQIDELSQRHIAFSGLTLLRDQIRHGGLKMGDLVWEAVDLSGDTVRGETSGSGPRAGDLMRVGDRFVILYEDQGLPGVLDYDDWCFDFVQGISARSLKDVFSGEGATVQWASLATPASAEGTASPGG